MSKSTTRPASASSDSSRRPSGGAASPSGVASFFFAPADPASLAFFRIGFGALLFLEVGRYVFGGRIARYFIEPPFHFTYFGFEWVRPWPGDGLYVHFGLLALAAALLTIGFLHRLSALALFLGFAYVFLLEQALYLNHFYLIVLLCGLFAVVPAHHAFSIDAWRRRETRPVPLWSISLLRTQIGLVYFFAGIAKLNPDWLHARPLVQWLEARATLPLIGPLVAEDWVAWVMSYGAIGLDLGAWPLLSSKRTRKAVFAVIVLFHFANSILFRIGIFPWLMMVATTIFFEPDWPRRWLGLPSTPTPAKESPPLAAPSAAPRGLVLALLAAYLLVQALVPLRHFLYPGDVQWTEEGHAFSWRMKLRGKSSEMTFLLTDGETGESWRVDPAAELTPWQVRSLGGRPDMILQYAHHLAAARRAEGRSRIEVRVAARTRLNGRPAQLLVDPVVDLAAEPRTLFPARWIQRAPP